MKNFKILLLGLSFAIIAIIATGCNGDAETLYKGVVVDKHYVDPSAGYRSNQEEQYLIYIREDITKKVIKVQVNVPTYYDLEKGSRTAFKLSNIDMYVLGNTSSSNTNLYGK